MIKNIALIGNPNCGKTTLFNSLTGSTAHVGNWPGVTVEKRVGKYKNKEKEEVAEIVDLPGIYSLSPYTPEEVISRNYILNEHPDCVINVADAMNFERSLFLTSQLLEMDVPVVLALNMMDILEKNNMSIDVKKVSEELQIPVIEVSALKFTNLDELIEIAIKEAENKRKGRVIFNTKRIDIINKTKQIYDDLCIDNSLFHAIKALENDKLEKDENENIYKKLLSENLIDNNFEKETVEERYQYFKNQILQYRQSSQLVDQNTDTKSDKIDKILTHKIFAIPILLLIVFAIFHITFGADLFYMKAMGLKLSNYPGAIAFEDINGEMFHPFANLFYDENGIVTIGEFLHRLIDGINNSIIEGIRLGISKAGGQEWVQGLVCDGILSGVSAVLGFLPQILLLFTFFSILEDSGYMARVAYVLDRIFRRFGVSGKAFIPMIMGFGCGVPAMINTRTLNSDKERTKTIRVIPFFTCSAKSEILVAVSAAFATSFKLDAGLFTFLMYIFGIFVAILAIILMNKTTLREKVAPFIMELSRYQRPGLYALFLHIVEKGKHFIKKAFTIILLSTIFIWVFANFTFNWKFIPTNEELDVSNSILAEFGMLLQPIFTPLGWGSQLNTIIVDGQTLSENCGWIYSVGAIQGTIAKENVVSTLETLGGLIQSNNNLTGITHIIQTTNITAGGLTSFTIFNMLTVPCFASVATAKSEIANKKLYHNTIFFWLGSSYVISALFYVMIDWVWTIGIIVPSILVIFATIYLYDKHKAKKELLLVDDDITKVSTKDTHSCCD